MATCTYKSMATMPKRPATRPATITLALIPAAVHGAPALSPPSDAPLPAGAVESVSGELCAVAVNSGFGRFPEGAEVLVLEAPVIVALTLSGIETSSCEAHVSASRP